MSKAKEKYYRDISEIELNLGKFPKITNYVTELEQQVEDLKRCGNCLSYLPCTYAEDICKIDKRTIEGDDYCKNWQFDGLSQKERIG